MDEILDTEEYQELSKDIVIKLFQLIEKCDFKFENSKDLALFLSIIQTNFHNDFDIDFAGMSYSYMTPNNMKM